MGLFSSKKKPASQDERRRYGRTPRTFIAQCDCGNRRSFSTVFNISKGGLGVFLEESVAVGTSIVVTLQHEFVNGAYNSEKINLRLPVTVAWVKPVDPKELSFPELEEKKFSAGLNLQALSSDVQKRFEGIVHASEKSA